MTGQLSFEDIWVETLSLARMNAIPIGAYCLAMISYTVLLAWIELPNDLAWFVYVIATLLFLVLASYLLTAAILRSIGMNPSKHGFLGFLLVSLFMGIGISIGVLFLVIPGLVLWARWSIAAPAYLVRSEDFAEIFGFSWDKTSGFTLRILVAHLPIWAMFVIATALSATPSGDSIESIAIESAVNMAGGVLSICLSVAIFRIVSNRSDLQ